MLAERADRYGLSVDEYKRRNLLHIEVTGAGSRAWSPSCAATPSPTTTGAQIPIDGGNDRVL